MVRCAYSSRVSRMRLLSGSICAAALIGLLAVAALCGITVLGGRPATLRDECARKLILLSAAKHSYEVLYELPLPSYTVDGTGRPLLSWRVLLSKVLAP